MTKSGKIWTCDSYFLNHYFSRRW